MSSPDTYWQNQFMRLQRQVRELQDRLDHKDRARTVIKHIAAKLTAVDANGNFSWTEVVFDADGNATTLTNGMSGTPTYNPARERNAKTVSAFPYYAELAFRTHTEDVGIVWEFDADEGFAGGSGSNSGGFDAATRKLKGVAHVAWSNEAGGGVITADEDMQTIPNATGNEGWIFAVPFTVTNGTIDRIGLLCGVSYAVTIGTGKFRLGIYSDNNFFPSTRLLDSGELTGANNSLVEATVSQAVTNENLYWAVAHLSTLDLSDLFSIAVVHPPSLGIMTGMLGVERATITTMAANGGQSTGYCKKIGALAALPSTFPADASRLPLSAAGETAMPAIWIRYAT